jgi:hypothetical protein
MTSLCRDWTDPGSARGQDLRMTDVIWARSAALIAHRLAATETCQTIAMAVAVQRMLGHASAAMTLDVYAGLFGDDLDAVATRLDEAVAARDSGYLRTGGMHARIVDLGKRRSPGR